MKLFLDLDGVLIDWCKGAHEIHEITLDQHVWQYKLGPEGWDWHKTVGMTSKELFEPMDKYFWENLEWTKDGREIFTLCETMFPDNMCFLTNPHNPSESIPGRLNWLDANCTKFKDRTLFGACKFVCARPNAVLVDDYDENIDDWRAHGGIGVLLPRPWNSNFYILNRQSAVNYLSQKLEGILHG